MVHEDPSWQTFMVLFVSVFPEGVPFHSLLCLQMNNVEFVLQILTKFSQQVGSILDLIRVDL